MIQPTRLQLRMEAKAKAEAREKAKSKAKAKATPAAPVVAVIDSDDGGTSSCSECEEIDTDVATGDDAGVSKVGNNNKKVSFSKGTMFVSSKPRRSVLERKGKVRKVDVKMLYDPQHTEQIYDCHKARAKAQLMRNMVLRKRKPKLETSQIRVPGSDIVITVVYNRKQDVFFELTPEHAYLKGLPEVRELCMVQPEVLKTQMKFIMDTGCGHDLVSQGKVTKNDLETFVGNKTMHFQTANGTTDSDIVARFSTNCFDEPVEAHILESTPSVLSVGKRCMNQGYSFIWPDGRDPYMVNREGQRIQLYVKGDIPYVKVGHEKSHRHDDEESIEVLRVLNSFKQNGTKDSGIEQRTTLPLSPTVRVRRRLPVLMSMARTLTPAEMTRQMMKASTEKAMKAAKKKLSRTTRLWMNGRNHLFRQSSVTKTKLRLTMGRVYHGKPKWALSKRKRTRSAICAPIDTGIPIVSHALEQRCAISRHGVELLSGR